MLGCPTKTDGDHNAFANSNLQLLDPAFLYSRDHRRTGDAWEKAAVASALRHEIVGELAQ